MSVLSEAPCKPTWKQKRMNIRYKTSFLCYVFFQLDIKKHSSSCFLFNNVCVHVSYLRQSSQSLMFCSYHPLKMGHVLNKAYNPHMYMFSRHPKALSQEPSAEYTYWIEHQSLNRLKIHKNQCRNSTKCRMNK